MPFLPWTLGVHRTISRSFQTTLFALIVLAGGAPDATADSVCEAEVLAALMDSDPGLYLQTFTQKRMRAKLDTIAGELKTARRLDDSQPRRGDVLGRGLNIVRHARSGQIYERVLPRLSAIRTALEAVRIKSLQCDEPCRSVQAKIDPLVVLGDEYHQSTKSMDHLALRTRPMWLSNPAKKTDILVGEILRQIPGFHLKLEEEPGAWSYFSGADDTKLVLESQPVQRGNSDANDIRKVYKALRSAIAKFEEAGGILRQGFVLVPTSQVNRMNSGSRPLPSPPDQLVTVLMLQNPGKSTIHSLAFAVLESW